MTGLELLDCVASEKTETEDRNNLAASIHEWWRILFRFENSGSWMCMGCMQNGGLSVEGRIARDDSAIDESERRFIHGRKEECKEGDFWKKPGDTGRSLVQGG